MQGVLTPVGKSVGPKGLSLTAPEKSELPLIDVSYSDGVRRLKPRFWHPGGLAEAGGYIRRLSFFSNREPAVNFISTGMRHERPLTATASSACFIPEMVLTHAQQESSPIVSPSRG